MRQTVRKVLQDSLEQDPLLRTVRETVRGILQDPLKAKFAEEDCVLFALVCAFAKLTFAQGQVFAVWPRPRQWLHVKIVFGPSVCTVGGFFCFQPHNTGLINRNHADVYARV